ncbi:MAG: helix-turn-helix transcriptional regulator [Spirochaetes bacterium]|nr:helix-turn-helix transcriptional regulator [Spirochaetota bacterium]
MSATNLISGNGLPIEAVYIMSGADFPAINRDIDWRELPCLLVAERIGASCRVRFSDGHSQIYRSGEAMIIPPYTRHRTEIIACTIPETTTYWVHINYTVAGLPLFPAIPLPVWADRRCGRTLGRIAGSFAAVGGSSLADSARIGELSYQLLSALLSLADIKKRVLGMVTERLRLAPVFAFISDHPGRTASVDELASVIGLSPSRFASLFHAVTGTTPIEYQRTARIRKASVMLLQGKKLAEIARTTGYGTPFSFSRAFKAVTGASPAAYKQRHQSM